MTSLFKVGQPIKYTEKVRRDLLKKLEIYITENEYPTMPKFCVINRISKQRIYEWAKDEKLNSESKPLGEYFTELIKQMNDKQECFIEENAMIGNITPSFAIFKLKQNSIGWTDRSELSLSNVDAQLKEIMNG